MYKNIMFKRKLNLYKFILKKFKIFLRSSLIFINSILNIFKLNLRRILIFLKSSLNVFKLNLRRILIFLKSSLILLNSILNIFKFLLKKIYIKGKSIFYEGRELFNIIRSFRRIEQISIFIKSKIFVIFYLLRHFFLYLYVGNYKKRLSYYRNIKSLIFNLKNKDISRLAIFLAYHKPDEIPLSNKLYVRSLINCGFKIIYLHNGKLNKNIIKEQENDNCTVICRLNYGHDLGACKDINILINNLGIKRKIDWLLWCNDSNFFSGERKCKNFRKKF